MLPCDAVFAFNADPQSVRVFLGRRLSRNVGNLSRYESRRAQVESYVALSLVLAKFLDLKPNLIQFIELVAGSNNVVEIEAVKQLIELKESHVLYWSSYSDTVVVGLFKVRLLKRAETVQPKNKNKNNRKLKIDAVNQMSDCLDRVYDYHKTKSGVLKSIPSSFFSVNQSQDYLTKIFSDPMAFDPRKCVPKDAFLWPWQQCVVARQNTTGIFRLEYTPITTVSLCMDLRFSTIAMGQVINPADFAEFINAVTRASKKIILDHDGYFDKETGDGVVGHFCHHDRQAHHQTDAELVANAITAGHAMIKEVQKFCDELQPKLAHGVNGLAAAVGVHLSRAVWLTDNGQIRAIGDSVVGAARLCSNAKRREIVLSNVCHTVLSKSVSSHLCKGMSEREINLKEINPEVGMYGYVSKSKTM